MKDRDVQTLVMAWFVGPLIAAWPLGIRGDLIATPNGQEPDPNWLSLTAVSL